MSATDRAEERRVREAGQPAPRASGNVPRLGDLFLSFLRLGAVSFGGPAMVAYIKRLAVAIRVITLVEEDLRAAIRALPVRRSPVRGP